MKVWHSRLSAVVGAILVSAGIAWAAQVINDDLTVNGNMTIAGNSTFTINSTVTPTFNAALNPVGGVGSALGTTKASYINTCQQAAQTSAAGTDATPVATEFYWAEMFIPSNVTVTGVAVMNGSVASGNIKVGLADASGNILATSATTAMAGTDAYQRVSFTATYAAKGPGTYYALQFVDNGTARINTLTFGNCITGKATGQVYATGFTAFTPGTTFTTALGPIAGLF